MAIREGARYPQGSRCAHGLPARVGASRGIPLQEVLSTADPGRDRRRWVQLCGHKYGAIVKASSPFSSAGAKAGAAVDPFKGALSRRDPTTAELEADNEAITRNAPLKKQSFSMGAGQLVLVASFTLITAAMLGTCYLVYEMGGITLAYD